MTAPVVTSHRLVVPVPDRGWLTIAFPREPSARTERALAWERMARKSVRAARLGELGEVHAVVTCRPMSVAKAGERGVHVGEDLRPSWHEVREVLRTAGVRCRSEELRLGPPTGELEPLMVVDLEVRRHG